MLFQKYANQVNWSHDVEVAKYILKIYHLYLTFHSLGSQDKIYSDKTAMLALNF